MPSAENNQEQYVHDGIIASSKTSTGWECRHFGFAPTKLPDEDSQTLGNKRPSLQRKATELQPLSSPEGTSERVQAVLMDRGRITLRSVDRKIDTMGVHEWLLEDVEHVR